MKYSVKYNNAATKKLLITHARANGHTVCSNFKNAGDGRYPYFNFDNGRDCVGERVYGAGYPSGEMIDLHEMIDILAKKEVTEVKLNDQYTAVINRDERTVQVGCQTVPFEKINELKSLIDKK